MDQIFLQRYTRIFEIRRRALRVKKNDEIQKEHASLSLYLSIYRKYAKCRTKADAHDKMGFQYISISVDIVRSHARIHRGDRGSGPPPHLKNHKNIEFLSNTGPDPLKFSKTTKPAYHQNASETPFKGVSLVGR